MKYEKLRKHIKKSGMTYKSFATKVLKVSPQNCDYKWAGKTRFTAKQIEIVKNYFGLTNDQVVEFFFGEGQ